MCILLKLYGSIMLYQDRLEVFKKKKLGWFFPPTWATDSRDSSPISGRSSKKQPKKIPKRFGSFQRAGSLRMALPQECHPAQTEWVEVHTSAAECHRKFLWKIASFAEGFARLQSKAVWSPECQSWLRGVFSHFSTETCRSVRHTSICSCHSSSIRQRRVKMRTLWPELSSGAFQLPTHSCATEVTSSHQAAGAAACMTGLLGSAALSPAQVAKCHPSSDLNGTVSYPQEKHQTKTKHKLKLMSCWTSMRHCKACSKTEHEFVRSKYKIEGNPNHPFIHFHRPVKPTPWHLLSLQGWPQLHSSTLFGPLWFPFLSKQNRQKVQT